jgi:hypothetical protein
MTEITYGKGSTALLFVDPYNDFLSEGGKLWPMLKAVAEESCATPSRPSRAR